MQKQITLLLLLILFSAFAPSGEPEIIKLACVGDSITDGDGLADRKTEAYPAILTKVLGEQYEVVNFGKSGATLLKKGDWPYWVKPAYEEVLAYQPDVITILLGANDSKPQNSPAFPGEFIEDLRAMVDRFQQLDSHPHLYICTPVPAYENRFHISDSVLVADVLPAIDLVAAEKHCEIIDLHTAFAGKREFFPDGVHPNKEGAVEIAKVIAAAIEKKQYK
jgi:lysophospholipase L1-like esterase